MRFDERMCSTIGVRVSADERRIILAEARKSGKTLSNYMRDAALRHATSKDETPAVTGSIVKAGVR